MSYNYDDMLSQHLTSQSPSDKNCKTTSDCKPHDRSPSSSSSHSSLSRTHRKKSKRSSHKRRSPSRSRSRSRSRSKRRHKDRDRKRDRSRDRDRSHHKRRNERDRDRKHRRRDDRDSSHKRHGSEFTDYPRDKYDKYNKNKTSHRSNHSLSSYHGGQHRTNGNNTDNKGGKLLLVTGEEIDEHEFTKKVEEELKAKEMEIEHSKLMKSKKTNIRKERLKRLQRLREEKKKKKSEEEMSPNTDSTVSIKNMDANSNNFQENGCDQNNNIQPQNVVNNTVNIQSENNAENEEDEEYDDIFAQNDCIMTIKKRCQHIKIANLNLTDNWDDSDGYYVVVPGDIIYDKYEVMGTSGRGVYSSVLRVVHHEKDNGDNKEYVIKVIRNNEHMKKQGLREIDFLRLLNGNNNIIKLYDSFWYRNHLCLLFEPMKCDLRRLLKSINISHSGLSINAVYQYTKQLLRALDLLQELNIIHADIKPDNILVSTDYRNVKLCDFGSSFKMDEVEITPTVGSRYYRAPEIMIGIKWSYQCDIWSLACTLFEIYTTNFLFRGANNNEMLFDMLNLCGLPPLTSSNKQSNTNYRNGMFYNQHFNENGDFLENKYDAVAQFDIQIPHKLINKAHCSSNNCLNQIILKKLQNIPNVNVQLTYQEKIKLNQFANLLSKMLNLNLNKRITPKQALKHPFCINPINTVNTKKK